MRINYVLTIGLFFLFCIFNSPVYPHTKDSAHTARQDVNFKQKNPDKNFHFAFSYGRASFSTRLDVTSAFAASGYPYHIISRSDLDAKSGQPVIYSISIERNLSKKIFVGLQYSALLNQKITGSNWDGAIRNNKPIPVERLDVEESYSSRFINAAVYFIPVPVNMVDSRLEVAIGAGLSYNVLKVSGIQRYDRRPNNFEILDDTTASFKRNGQGLGLLFSTSIDFYWTRSISTQFKLDFRASPDLVIPEQTYTYLTTRNRIRMADTQTLKKHKISYSGAAFNLSFRFHL